MRLVNSSRDTNHFNLFLLLLNLNSKSCTCASFCPTHGKSPHRKFWLADEKEKDKFLSVQFKDFLLQSQLSESISKGPIMEEVVAYQSE